LRDRREDVPALVEAFVRRFNLEEGRRVAGASSETLALLTAFDWPGNVGSWKTRSIAPSSWPTRLSAAARLPGHLGPEDAPPQNVASFPACRQRRSAHRRHAKTAPVRILDDRGHLPLEDIEHDLIQLAIEIYAGHMSEVARRLGIGAPPLSQGPRTGLEDQVRESA